MYYKEFRGNRISALGLGSLRLPTVSGNTSSIDRAKACLLYTSDAADD